MTGTIQGGWEFVWTTYAVTATALGLYAAALVWRLVHPPPAHEREAP